MSSRFDDHLLNGTSGAGSINPASEDRAQAQRPVPEPLPKPRRMVDLSAAAMPTSQTLRPVESLVVQHLRGAGATFTPNLNAAQAFLAIGYKPGGAFQENHQIVAGALQNENCLRAKLRRVAFIPAFSWAALELALVPVKLTSYGKRIMADLERQRLRFPNYKVYVEWVETRRRHVVYVDDLTEEEAQIIQQVKWPTPEEIQEALSPLAYDNLDDLAADNEEIRTARRAKEVQ